MRIQRTLVIAILAALVLSSVGLTMTQAQEDGATAWLGVGVNDSDDGVLVAQIGDDSPAADAEIMTGDIITAVDDTPVETAEALIDAVGSYAPGDDATITLLRDGEELTVNVTFAERPADLNRLPDDDGDSDDSDGDSDDDSATRPFPPMLGTLSMFGLDADMTDDGLSIQSIDADSPLADSDLQAGDVVTAVNGDSVTEMLPRELMETLTNSDELTLTVNRDGDEVEIMLNITDLFGGTSMPEFYFTPDRVTPPTQLGISFSTLDADVAAEEELDVEDGALVREVFDDTPAAEAGLQPGDVITAVDGDVVDAERILTDRLYAYEEGDVVTLSVLRDGEPIELDVTLGPPTVGFRSRGMPFGGPGFGQGRGRGMMPFFMHPEMGGFFSEDFLENHPFMQDWLENMPEDGFHYYHGTPDEMMPDGMMPDDTTPEVPGTSA